jgi:oligopeptide/dipeptide ABC transporter ATP-binding protein
VTTLARSEAGPDAPLLRVCDLSVRFPVDAGSILAVDRVSFDVPRGRTVALVGESGAGKSATAHALLRLIPPAGLIAGGQVHFEGQDLLAAPERALERVRGGRIGVVFQDPMTSLNPVYSIGAQLGEALRLHRPVSRARARARSLELLHWVGFPEPERRIDDYPHELSGGMRQRALIAMALACDPALLIADEPTTALDMSVQAQILELLRRLRHELGMSLLLVAHDLDVVAELADEVLVMYAGQIVEQGPARAVLRRPLHPYTRALLACTPPDDAPARRLDDRGRRLPTIAGAVPDPRRLPAGCRFEPRCAERFGRCAIETPELTQVGPTAVRCFLHEPERTGELEP